MTLVQIPLGQVVAPTQAIRSNVDRQSLGGLVESVRTHGVINPVTVVRTLSAYRLVAGRRRFLAAVAAKLETIPAHVVEADEQRAFELSLVENIHREDLDPIDEAKAIRSLMRSLGFGVDRVARHLGKSSQWVYQRLKLLDLVPEAQAAIKSGEMSLVRAREAVQDSEEGQVNLVRALQIRSPRPPNSRRPPQSWRQKATRLLQWKLTDAEGAILLEVIERTIKELQAKGGLAS